MPRRQPLNYENQDNAKQFTEWINFRCTSWQKNKLKEITNKKGQGIGSLLRFLINDFIKKDAEGWRPR